MKRALLVVAFCLVFLPGCAVPWQRTTQQSELWPVLPEPDQVILLMPEDIKAGENEKVDRMIDALFTAVKEVEKWHGIVNTYNARAKEHNARVEKNLGIRSEIQ